MLSVKDLPANVRLGEAKREEVGSDSTKLPADKGDNSKGDVERREQDITSKSRHLRELSTTVFFFFFFFFFFFVCVCVCVCVCVIFLQRRHFL